jgi:UDP-N-acetyl-D-galactosamine dehydrogenase
MPRSAFHSALMKLSPPDRISVIGLGYVGLPLAVALSKHFSVVGYDISAERVAELERGHDRTGEVAATALAQSPALFTTEPTDMAGSGVFIVAVPTPVNADKRPDLEPLRTACRVVGRQIGPGAIVAFESTVYPGATEQICGPLLAEASGLACGTEFHLGYSPERMNPGDPEHTLENIVKIVAGQTPEATALLADLYGRVTERGVHVTRDIATAEAAKVIENAQRDINIAFVNEVTQIFAELGVSAHDALDAAATKWNFLDFRPGLVGGHCIGVDPYYLAYCAQQVGCEPNMVLSGRRTNDGMAAWIAGRIDGMLGGRSRILVLGLTFKENVPDLRNSGAAGLVDGLVDAGHDVSVHDPLADPAEAQATYGLELLSELSGAYGCVVGAVAHRAYADMNEKALGALLPEGGLVADVKGMWRRLALPDNMRLWQL